MIQWRIYSGQNRFHLYLQSYKPCDSVPKLINQSDPHLKITLFKQNGEFYKIMQEKALVSVWE